jgi:hypothetical protein
VNSHLHKCQRQVHTEKDHKSDKKPNETVVCCCSSANHQAEIKGSMYQPRDEQHLWHN